MKKITLITLIVFGVILLGIAGLSVMYPPITPATTSPQMIANSGGPLTSSEVTKHNSSSSCYLIVEKKVYDVTSYIGRHPGGRRTITSNCGREVTGIFASIHSNFAWDLLGDYYIGPLVTAETAQTASTSSDTESPTLDQLNMLKNALSKQYPNSEIINVKPKKDFYVAKIIYNNVLYEVHVDANGNILNQEVGNDEYDWDLWDTDTDDK